MLDEKGRYTKQGSEVRLYVPGTRTLLGTTIVDTGSGYCSQNAMPVHFGLGSHVGPVDVEVTGTPLDRPELVDVAASQTHLLPVGERTATLLARLEHDTGVRPGHIVELALDVRRLHFFDLESGSAVPRAEAPVTAAAVG